MSIDHIVGTGRAFAALNGDGSVVTSHEAASARPTALPGEDCAQAIASDFVYGTSRTSISDHRRRRSWTLSTFLHSCSVRVQLLERMTDVATGMRRQFIDRFDEWWMPLPGCWCSSLAATTPGNPWSFSLRSKRERPSG